MTVAQNLLGASQYVLASHPSVMFRRVAHRSEFFVGKGISCNSTSSHAVEEVIVPFPEASRSALRARVHLD